MRLVTHAEIRNFRSIESLVLDFGALSAFVGGNGSGKSNVFRALNTFFNGHVEGLERLDFSRDFHKPWRTTKNRSIEIDVGFELPPVFSIRKEVGEPLEPLGLIPQSQFTIRKHWTRDQVREGSVAEDVYLKLSDAADFRKLSTDEARVVARFLQLIKFRYIPSGVSA